MTGDLALEHDPAIRSEDVTSARYRPFRSGIRMENRPLGAVVACLTRCPLRLIETSISEMHASSPLSVVIRPLAMR